MTDLERMANELDALMRAHRLSQRALARRSGVHVNVINRFLSAEALSRWSTLQRLFRVFDCTIHVAVARVTVTTSGVSVLR